MLDPPGLREDLAEFPLGNAPNRAAVIKNDRSGTGRSLIQCQNKGHKGVRGLVAPGFLRRFLALPRGFVKAAAVTQGSASRPKTR